MVRVVTLLLALLALAASPAAALAAAAQQDPSLLDPTPQEQPLQEAVEQQQPAPAQQTSATTDDGSIGRGELVLIGIGIVALIGGIWVVISRDARRVTAGRIPSESDALRGGSATRASQRSRKLSSAEKRRRKRGRARS